MAPFTPGKPQAGEYGLHFGKYIELISGPDIIGPLRTQFAASMSTLHAVSEADSLKRYAEGKWSLREVVGHVTDTERIMAYRALRIARNDATPLPTFDQDAYINAAKFDERTWPGLLDEWDSTRRSNLMLFEGLPDEAWTRMGTASGHSISVRALAYIIAGHELHHMRIVRERYLAG